MSDQTTRRWTVALTAIGSLMAALDTLVVASALGTIRLDLGASVAQLEWTVNAYNLSFAVLLITGAALGDRLGRRRMYAVGLTLFALASAACALAPNVGLLIAARAVQGAGAALVMPLGLALLSAAFPPERRGAAIGMFSAITGVAVALGPLVGGAVVEGIDWEWIFWLNVPIGLIAAPLVLARVRESFGSATSLDLPGLALVTGAALGIVWGLVRANDAGWGSFEVIGSLAAGIGARDRLRRLGAPCPRADAGDAAVRAALVLGRQRGDLLHLRLPVQLRVPVRAVPADLARLRPARRRAAPDPVDDHLHPRRPGRRRARRPDRRAPADARRAPAADGRASSGSR